jgi:hypothetical protein
MFSILLCVCNRACFSNLAEPAYLQISNVRSLWIHSTMYKHKGLAVGLSTHTPARPAQFYCLLDEYRPTSDVIEHNHTKYRFVYISDINCVCSSCTLYIAMLLLQFNVVCFLFSSILWCTGVPWTYIAVFCGVYTMDLFLLSSILWSTMDHIIGCWL